MECIFLDIGVNLIVIARKQINSLRWKISLSICVNEFLRALKWKIKLFDKDVNEKIEKRDKELMDFPGKDLKVKPPVVTRLLQSSGGIM